MVPTRCKVAVFVVVPPQAFAAAIVYVTSSLTGPVLVCLGWAVTTRLPLIASLLRGSTRRSLHWRSTNST